MSAFLLLLAAMGIFALCFAGIGLAILVGRRRRIGACACDFDADRDRACACPDAERGRCPDRSKPAR